MSRTFLKLLCLTMAFAAALPAARDARAHARDLPFFYDLYTFRGERGGTAVVAAFAVEAGELERERDRHGVRYRFDVSLILADTASKAVLQTHDSVFVRKPRPLRRDALLRAHLELNVPPTRTTLHRVILSNATSPGIGQLYHGPFPIPDYRGAGLMLSDLAWGLPDADPDWRRGDVALALVPTGQLEHGSFDLFYEVYNLPGGHAYTTEVSVQRLDKSLGARIRDIVGAGDDVRVRFAGESPAGPDATVPELRRIDSDLGEGRYRMTVTVRDRTTGRSASRSRVFEIPE
jgi:hypothetical protein